jgi:hypothetical protein
VDSLIIPVAILLILGLWGTFQSRSTFRKEFRRRGKDWQATCSALDRGEGVLIVDTLWGPERGFGRPAIWWIDQSPQNQDLALQLQNAALLVKCPASMRNLDALKQRFGPERVISHTWSLAETADTRR